jgi:hypothetical protein
MPEFGSYETVDELSQHGPTTVYTARRARSQEGALYVIKTFIPISVSEQAKRDIDRFLKAARSQQKVATGEGRCWAPILECGTIAGGAFYVTRFYPRSAQQLIDGRVKLTHRALCHIVQCAATGLIQLKQATGRSHGNLKPGKILISGEREVSRAEVVLSDALESVAAQSAEGEPADLRAVGHIIHQLVVHRPFSPEESWPLRPSEKWARLGKSAEQWRDLCQRLLAPKRGPQVASLEELAREVSSFREDRLFSPVKAGLAALAVVVAIGVGAVVYRHAEQIGRFVARILPGGKDTGGVRFDQAKWKELCEEHYSWFGRLYGQLDERTAPERWVNWSKDKYLNENVVSAIAAARSRQVQFNPREIAKVDSGVTFQELKSKPPESARTPEAAQQCNDALRTVREVESALMQRWPLLAEYRRLSAEWQGERGWHGPGRYLASLASGVAPGNPELAAAVDEAVAAAAAVEAVQKSWAEIQSVFDQKMKNSGFPPVKDFMDACVLKRTRTEKVEDPVDGGKTGRDLDILREELERLNAFANLLAGFLDGDWKRIDRERLSRSELNLELPSQPITSKVDFGNWLKPLMAYVQESPGGK